MDHRGKNASTFSLLNSMWSWQIGQSERWRYDAMSLIQAFIHDAISAGTPRCLLRRQRAAIACSRSTIPVRHFATPSFLVAHHWGKEREGRVAAQWRTSLSNKSNQHLLRTIRHDHQVAERHRRQSLLVDTVALCWWVQYRISLEHIIVKIAAAALSVDLSVGRLFGFCPSSLLSSSARRKMSHVRRISLRRYTFCH